MMDNLSPTKAFIKVDFPTFGFPIIFTKPALCAIIMRIKKPKTQVGFSVLVYLVDCSDEISNNFLLDFESFLMFFENIKI